MLHQPEKYITEWKNMKKSDTVKEMQINEVGENGIERKLKTNKLLLSTQLSTEVFNYHITYTKAVKYICLNKS